MFYRTADNLEMVLVSFVVIASIGLITQLLIVYSRRKDISRLFDDIEQFVNLSNVPISYDMRLNGLKSDYK